MSQDRHSEQRHILNVMRGDYADALTLRIDDDDAYDALVNSLEKQMDAGFLDHHQVIKLLAFATRRLAITKLEAKMAPAFVMHTPN